MFDPFSDDGDGTAWGGRDEPTAPRLRMSLRIRGTALDPDFLTQHLGVAPTASGAGHWTYRLDAPPDTELGDAIDMLLARVPNDATLWEEIAGTWAIDVHCAIGLEAATHATAIDASVLERLARLGLALTFELHDSSTPMPMDDDDDTGEDDDA
jgi:hypothetical protein